MDPLEMKYNEVSTSPLCTSVSPGGAWVVLNFNDKALKCIIYFIKVFIFKFYCKAL